MFDDFANKLAAVPPGPQKLVTWLQVHFHVGLVLIAYHLPIQAKNCQILYISIQNHFQSEFQKFPLILLVHA